jgi:hypothetical protein
MKELYIFLLAIFSSFPLFAQNATISLPEMAVLYRGYDNKILPVVGCDEQIELVCSEGASISKSIWADDSGKEINGYIVKVGNTNNVRISLFGVSPKGIKTEYGTFNYKVRAFPNPELITTTVSKTMGCKLSIALGADVSFTGVSFSVVGGEIIIGKDTNVFSGHVIPASILEKAKPGQKVTLVLRYHSPVGAVKTMSSVLEVVP